MTDNAPSRLTNARAAMIIAIAAFVAFFPLFSAEFTFWDDPHTVASNPRMVAIRDDSFTHYWERPVADIYIPITYTVWTLVAMLARVPAGEFGIALNPMMFHGVNVLFHALTGIAAFGLLLRVFENRVAALMGALVMVLHPVQVESVAWVSGLKDVLAGTLTLAALWQYAAFCRDGKQWRYVTSLVLYVLAMLAKPSAMTTPLLIAVIDWLIRPQLQIKPLLLRVIPYLVLAIPIALIARHAQPALETVSPLWARPLVMLDAISFYLVKLVAPFSLIIDYARGPTDIIRSGEIYYTWILSVVVIVAALIAARRTRVPIAAMLLFIFAPLHVLGLIPFDFQGISTVADHYQYVALLGPALLVAWICMKQPRRGLAVVVVLVALLGIKSFLQSRLWHDHLTLMNATYAANPRSGVALNGLATYYERTNQKDLALEYARKNVEIDPDDPLAHLNRGIIEMELGMPDAAAQSYEAMMALYDRRFGAGAPETAAGRLRISQAYFESEKFDKAREQAELALKLAPDNEGAKRMLTRIPPPGRKQ